MIRIIHTTIPHEGDRGVPHPITVPREGDRGDVWFRCVSQVAEAVAKGVKGRSTHPTVPTVAVLDRSFL